jgi:hypothetical protein
MAWEVEAESSTRRFILKALRESSGELFGQFSNLNERALRWRPGPGEWCLKEIAGHLRDAEELYRRQLELIARETAPLLPHESLDVLILENDYREERIGYLLGEFEAAREETFWLLRMLGEDDWHRTGIHPYRGPITVLDIAREMHEHDLEYLYKAQRLRKALPQR